MAHSRSVRKHSTKQSVDVRYSDRGYAYAQLSRVGEVSGLVGSFTSADRPPLEDIPKGILIHNKDTDCLELSDPEGGRWIPFCSVSMGGVIGLPTDGDFTDGAVIINPSGTVADAVDSINEYLVSSAFIDYASHLGTTDGVTNGVLVEPTFVLGRVSTPATYGSPFYSGGWDTDENRDLTNQGSIIWQLSSGEKITDLQSGSIVVRFYNGASTLLHTETLNLDGSLNTQTSNPNHIVEVNSLEVKVSRIEGFLKVTIPASTLLGSNSGYLRVSITHTIDGTDYSDSDLEFFMDSSSGPSIASQTVTLDSAPVKYLSGVKYATVSGSSNVRLQIGVASNNLFSDTYRADPILVDSSNFGITDFVIPYNSAAASKNGSSPPTAPFVYNENFVYSDIKEISNTAIVNPAQNGSSLQLRFILRDPFNTNNGALFSPTPEILINTYPINSTDLCEYFFDEDYRLESSSSGTLEMLDIHGEDRGSDAWDSSLSLNTRSALQVINGALVYPQIDFSSTVPSPNPDYSSLGTGTGDLTYIRRFKDPVGMARSNGILRIDGLSEATRLSKDILIELRLVGDHEVGNGVQGPGNEGTGWLSLNDSFNVATFLADDGDGCFVNTQGLSAPYFEFTLGGFSTVYAANGAIEVRITYKDPEALNARITRLEITNWT